MVTRMRAIVKNPAHRGGFKTQILNTKNRDPEIKMPTLIVLKLHPLFSVDSLDIVQYPKNVNPDDILFKILPSLILLTIVNPLKIN